MKRWLLAVAALVLAIACFPVVNWAVPKLMHGEFSSVADGQTTSAQGGAAGVPLKTKSANRPPSGPRPTHGPQQWRDFYLPAQEINGLTLAEALNQLRAAYEATCRETGEVPLSVTFAVPAGNATRIHLKLGPRTLESSVHLLAAIGKLTVQRHGREYRFTAAAAQPGRQTTESLEIQPDFQAKLFPATDGIELAPGDPFAPPDLFAPPAAAQTMSADSLRAAMAASGLELDPSTRLSLQPDSKLTIDTTSAADRAAIASLVESTKLDPTLQAKITTKTLEVPAGVAWNYPDGAVLDDAQTQALFREMAQSKGVELVTAPSVIGRAGQPAKIEIGREFITQVKGTENVFETHMVGVAINLNASPLGLGHQLDAKYTDTSAGFDPASGEPAFTERAAVRGSGFSGDTGTRVQVQTHPDGSRTVFLVTPTLIDATGRPLHPAENP